MSSLGKITRDEELRLRRLCKSMIREFGGMCYNEGKLSITPRRIVGVFYSREMKTAYFINQETMSHRFDIGWPEDGLQHPKIWIRKFKRVNGRYHSLKIDDNNVSTLRAIKKKNE